MTMRSGALRELHLLHQQLRELRGQLERGPRQLEARRQHLAKKQAELESAMADVKRARMLADQKALQLKEREESIAKLKRQLNEARSNKEYQALRDHIDADTMAGSVLEDEILENLAKVDQMKGTAAALEQEVQKAEADLKQFESDLVDQRQRLEGDVAMLEESLVEAERSLPAEAAEAYRRLVAARGADAMAAVEENTCTGCFTSVTPQMYVELRMDYLVFCKSCGRLLYLGPSEAPE